VRHGGADAFTGQSTRPSPNATERTASRVFPEPRCGDRRV